MAPNLTLTPELQQAEGTLAPTPAAQPVAVAAPQVAAPAPTAGAAALGSTDDQAADAALQMRLSQPAPNSFGAKLGAALDKPENAIPLTASGKPVPGGWARSLVGATQGVLAGLGDAPTGKAPVGGGIMSGIAGTIRNRNERLAAQNEQKDKQAQQDKENARQDRKESREDQEFKLNMAAANARMQNEQKLAHQTDAAPMIAANQKFVKMISNPDSPYAIQPIAEDQTYAQIQKGVVDGKWNTYEYSAYPTGTLIERGKEGTELAVPTGENYQDGGVNPTTTYTLFKFDPNQKVKFDDSTPEGKANIKFINNYKGANQPLTSGQELTIDQANHVWQTASDVKAATDARNKTLLDNKLATQKDIEGLEPSELGKNPLWINALANSKDVVDAANKIRKNPAFLAQFPDFDKILHADYPTYDKLLEMRETEDAKAREKAADAAANISGIPMTDEMQASINALPKDKLNMLTAATPKDTSLRATLYSLALNDGTVDMDKVFPNRTYKGGQTMTLQDALGIAKQLNPQISEQNYRLMSKALAATLPGTSKGDAIEQYNNVIQHSAELQDVMNATGASRPAKFYNTALNVMESEGWGTDPTRIISAQDAVKGEFTQLMAGNYKPTEEMQAEYNKVINPASTPNQIAAALKTLASLGSIRLQNMDERYKALAGKHVPNLITPEAMAAAEHLGLNTKYGDPAAYARLKSLDSGGQQFTPGIPAENKPQAIQPPSPQTHVFDTAVWLARHPGQDVTAVSAAAKAAGYQVK